MKIKTVIFSKNGVRIVNGEYSAKENEQILVNPIFPKGIPPNYWKLENNKIIEMTNNEKIEVDEKQKEIVVMPDKCIKNKNSYFYSYNQSILISIIVSFVSSLIFYLIFKLTTI